MQSTMKYVQAPSTQAEPVQGSRSASRQSASCMHTVKPGPLWASACVRENQEPPVATKPAPSTRSAPRRSRIASKPRVMQSKRSPSTSPLPALDRQCRAFLGQQRLRRKIRSSVQPRQSRLSGSGRPPRSFGALPVTCAWCVSGPEMSGRGPIQRVAHRDASLTGQRETRRGRQTLGLPTRRARSPKEPRTRTAGSSSSSSGRGCRGSPPRRCCSP